MNIFVSNSSREITLGRVGENVITRVIFPVKKWIEKFGVGEFRVLHQRNGDTEPYIIANTEEMPNHIVLDGDELVWTLYAVDCAKIGIGIAQIYYYVNGVLAKSEKFDTIVDWAFTGEGVEHSVYEDIVTETLENAIRAEQASEHGPYIAANGHWIVWDSDESEYKDSGINANGKNIKIHSLTEKTSLNSADEFVLYDVENDGNKKVTWENIKNSVATGKTDSEAHKLKKIANYLHYISFESLNYEVGNEFYQKYIPENAACSAVRKGNILGRNFDWYYNETAEFIVKTERSADTFASIGVALARKSITDSVATERDWNRDFDIIPFQMLDGVNENGVSFTINMVYAGDKGYTTGTNPLGESMCVLMLGRYILDKAESASDIVGKIQNDLNVWAPVIEGEHQEYHFMIADAESTYIVEFAENSVKVFSNEDDEYPDIPGNKTVITNFYVDGWDGEIVVGLEHGEISPAATTLTAHAMGVERYQKLVSGYSSVISRADMLELMKAVRFTKSYSRVANPFWYTEFVGNHGTEYGGDLTIYRDAEDYSAFVNKAIDEYENRQRDGKTWNTVHTSIIDISQKKIWVYVQENDEEYTFDLMNEVPTKLSQLEDDENHRLVTDAEKERWIDRNNQAAKTDSMTKEVGVDENGKLWCGGGNEDRYELIERAVITEDSAVFERDEEPDGTPYNFKRLAVKISGEDTVSGDTKCISAYVNTNDTTYNIGINFVNASNTVYNDCYAEFYKEFGFWNANGYKPNTAPVNGSEGMMYGANNKFNFPDNGSINKVKVNFLNSLTKIAKGTYISIYGIRG